MRCGLLGSVAAIILAASLSPVAAFGSGTDITDSSQSDASMSVPSNEIVPFNNKDTRFEYNMKYHGSTSATGYRASVQGPHRMRNFVNEWGYSHARLSSWNDISDQAYVSGLWSPDSYPNAGYPELPSA